MDLFFVHFSETIAQRVHPSTQRISTDHAPRLRFPPSNPLHPNASSRHNKMPPRTAALAAALLLLHAASAAAQPMAEPDGLNPDTDLIPPVARWRPEDLPLPVYLIGATPDGLSLADAQTAARAAIDAWATVGCIAPPLVWRGHLDSPDQLPPGAVPIAFVTPSPDGCFWDGWDNSAITISDCYAAAPAAILVNNNRRWALAPDYLQQLSTPPAQPTTSITGVLTHELGHVLGLGHAKDSPLATMAPNYLTDGGMASLSALDRAALCTLYAPPAARSACDSDAACVASLDDAGATCAQPLDGVRACEEDRGGVGAYCAHNLLLCDEVCYVSSPTTGTGFCTASCIADTDCPDGWSCQEAGANARLVCLPVVTYAEPTGCTSAAPRGAAQPAAPLMALLAWAWARSRRWRRRAAQASRPTPPAGRSPRSAT